MQSCSQKASSRVHILPAEQRSQSEKENASSVRSSDIGHVIVQKTRMKNWPRFSLLIDKDLHQVSKKNDDGKAPIDQNGKDIAQEKKFDAMEICTEDTRSPGGKKSVTMTSRKPENLVIKTGSEIKSYRVPNTAEN